MVDWGFHKKETGPQPGQMPRPNPGSSVFAKKQVPTVGKELKKMSDDILEVSRRIKLMEDRLDALRKHFDILDSSLITKHKTTIKELRHMEEGMREIRDQVRENSSMTNRIVKRLEAFATRDKVAVLEKYISMWQPLKYTTAQDVERIVDEKLATLSEDE